MEKKPNKSNLVFCSELNLARNRISALPNELSNCSQLDTIDISANSFVALPPVLQDIPSLRKVNASKNFIAGK